LIELQAINQRASVWRDTQPNSKTSLSQSIQLVGGQNVKEAAKDQADERHNEALYPSFRKLKKSRRYKAGDKSSYAKIAEEGCSKLQPFVVNYVGHWHISSSSRGHLRPGGAQTYQSFLSDLFQWQVAQRPNAYSRPGRQAST
jgi:hypothetical protein